MVKIGNPLGRIAIYLVGSRLLFLLFAAIAVYLVPTSFGYLGSQVAPKDPYFVWIWANLDGRHFVNIATLGYRNFDFAYFPFYPTLIYLLKRILSVSPVYVGIGISTVSLFLSSVVLYKIARLDFSKKTAELAVFVLCIFPVSFFLHSVYADALFLLVSTTSFYFARKGNWVWAGIFAGMATLTRLSGIALLPALALEWYIQNKEKGTVKELLPKFFKNGAIALVLGAMGTLGYMLFLHVVFKNFLLFQKSMVAWRQSEIVLPIQVFARYAKILYFVDKHLFVYWVAVLEITSLIAYLTVAWFVFRRVRTSYGLFMLVLLILVGFTGTFAGTPRYILHLFPGFIGMTVLLENSKFKGVILFAMIALGAVLTALFTRGYFIS